MPLDRIITAVIKFENKIYASSYNGAKWSEVNPSIVYVVKLVKCSIRRYLLSPDMTTCALLLLPGEANSYCCLCFPLTNLTNSSSLQNGQTAVIPAVFLLKYDSKNNFSSKGRFPFLYFVITSRK